VISHLGLYVAALALSVSCQSVRPGIEVKAIEVFRGFTLVGHGPAKFDSDGSLDVTYVVPHGDVEEPPPAKLQAGLQYVFHHREGPADNEQLGLEQLPARLKQLGFTVLESPEYNGGQFSYPYQGGPYFYIIFTDGNRKGVLFNRVDVNVRDKNWIVEDYVLVLLP
jgi:hypothetical protein